MVRCGSKNEYQRDMCLEEIGPRAQFVMTILVFILSVDFSFFVFLGGAL